jgi:hypothetical protein
MGRGWWYRRCTCRPDKHRPGCTGRRLHTGHLAGRRSRRHPPHKSLPCRLPWVMDNRPRSDTAALQATHPRWHRPPRRFVHRPAARHQAANHFLNQLLARQRRPRPATSRFGPRWRHWPGIVCDRSGVLTSAHCQQQERVPLPNVVYRHTLRAAALCPFAQVAMVPAASVSVWQGHLKQDAAPSRATSRRTAGPWCQSAPCRRHAGILYGFSGR